MTVMRAALGWLLSPGRPAPAWYAGERALVVACDRSR
jgi:hypothetical protein